MFSLATYPWWPLKYDLSSDTSHICGILQVKQMAQKDERIKIINEVISGIKVL